MEAEEQVNEKKSPIKIILNIAYYAVLSVIILLAVFFMVMTFSTKNGVTNIFGYIISSVQSDSMSGTFETGDIIFIQQCDAQDIEVEDIVTFYYLEPQSQQTIIVTHRAIEIQENRIITQGDVARKNGSVDKVEYVGFGDVIGEYTGARLPWFGFVIDFLKSKVGFFCCILLPIFLFLFYQIYVFIRTVLELKSDDGEEDTKEDALVLAEQIVHNMKEQAAQGASAEGSLEGNSSPASTTEEDGSPPANDSPSKGTEE